MFSPRSSKRNLMAHRNISAVRPVNRWPRETRKYIEVAPGALSEEQVDAYADLVLRAIMSKNFYPRGVA